MRTTLTLTWAPILKRRVAMVPAAALANQMGLSVMRRTAANSRVYPVGTSSVIRQAICA